MSGSLENQMSRVAESSRRLMHYIFCMADNKTTSNGYQHSYFVLFEMKKYMHRLKGRYF